MIILIHLIKNFMKTTSSNIKKIMTTYGLAVVYEIDTINRKIYCRIGNVHLILPFGSFYFIN